MDLLPFSEAEHRVRRLQAWMQQALVDAVFILQNTDLYYFSGTIQRGLLCLPANGNPIYLVNKSLSRAKIEAVWDWVVPMRKLEDARRILEGEGVRSLRRIGLEMDVLPANFYFKLEHIFPETEFVDASGAIRKLRMIKSSYEAGQIRNAVQMVIEAWQRAAEWICPGITELEALAHAEHFLRLQGHQGILRTRTFNCEIGYGAFAAGSNACFPTSFPGSTGFIGLYPAISNAGSKRLLARGEAILVDIAGGYGGYLADAARTFAIGYLAADLLTAHEQVLALNHEIESMLKPETSCHAICKHAFEYIETIECAGFFMGAGDNHLRYIGHGVGLELDELPVLASGNETKLKPGMILAIEPKIFFPDRGGVGIENMYLITETGFEKLTPYCESIIFI